MTKRRLLLLALVCCIGLGAWFAYVCWFSPGGINRATVLRIKAGMHEKDVERIIGCPHGDYRSVRGLTVAELGSRDGKHARFWHGDSGYIVVWFDADRTVNERSFTPASETWMDRVAEWLGMN